MAVGVAPADLDRRELRVGALEHGREPLVGAAVVGDLERLHLGQRERGGDVRLGVGREQQVEVADLHVRDERAVVRVALRPEVRLGRRRPQQLHPDAPERERLPGMGGHPPRGAGRMRQTVLDGGRPARAAVHDHPRRHFAQDRQRRALVVALRMRDHQSVEPLHARLGQPPQDRPAGRAGVDQNGDAVLLQQRRIALADIEEGDHELAARRRRHAVAAGRGRQDQHEHGDGDRHRSHPAARGP